jgi:hypothetical protein
MSDADANDRPHWQTVVAEKEKFLKSLETE